MSKFLDDVFDKLAFLEPRDFGDSPLIEELGLDTPIPVLVDDMMQEISSGQAEENISGASVLKGMIYLLGADPEFKHNESYFNLLNRQKEEVLVFINQLIADSVHDENYVDAYIYTNAKTRFDESAEIEKNLIMENIYNQNWPPSSEEEAEELGQLLQEIIGNYENILNNDETNPQANLRLAEIHRALGQFIKSRLYYERALHNSDEEDQMLIRNSLEEISNEVHLESAETYLAYGRVSEALAELDQIADSYLNLGKIYFLKGVASDGLGDLQTAEENYKKAIEEDRTQSDYYNNYAIVLSKRDSMKEALNALTLGLEMNPDDRRLNYNRGSIYYYMGDLESALSDFIIAKGDQEDPKLQEIITKIKSEIEGS